VDRIDAGVHSERAAHVYDEAAQQRRADGRVADLGVELKAVAPGGLIDHCGDRGVGRARQRQETGRHALDPVAM
jgi:hypothetical protein